MKKIVIILLASIFLCFLVFIVGLRIYLDMSPGRDFYHYVDEDERYEFLMIGDNVVLRDEEENIGLAGDIEKYIQRKPYVYVIRGQSFSSATTEDGITYYYDRNPDSGERIEYEDISEIPLYMVLNYETGEVTKYMSLDEMPEEISSIFEEPLTDNCLMERTCYEKEGADLY